jgi:hypothetical protein
VVDPWRSILDLEAFSIWKHSGSSSLLWIHGKRLYFTPSYFAEAHVSILSSRCRKEYPFVCCCLSISFAEAHNFLLPSSSIIQDIQGICAVGLASLAFYYCDFRDDQKKGLRGLLSSLLVQLCDQSDAYYGVLSDFYSAHRSGEQQASDEALVQCLKQMLKLPKEPTVYIIIDALDECPATSGLPTPREEVLELVTELVRLQIPDLRICVTSRPEADIEPVFGPLAFQSVTLHRESGQAQDIAEYVKYVVNMYPKMRTWRQEDKEHVIEVLTGKADGM